MAAFSSLTPEEQKAVIDFSSALRGNIGELARCLNRLAALNENYVGVIGPILNLLTPPDNAVPITDHSNLAGTMPLTPYEMGVMMNDIQTELTIYDAQHTQLWSKACGPTNMVG